jgi:hypothetical protein
LIANLASKADFMRNDNHCHAASSQFLHHYENLSNQFRVECRCRFIEKNKRRIFFMEIFDELTRMLCVFEYIRHF